MKPVTIKLSDLLFVVCSILVLCTGVALGLWRSNRADRLYAHSRARDSLIQIYRAEVKARREGAPCYLGLAQMAATKRIVVSDRVGVLVRGYTIVVNIAPNCASFRAVSYPDQPLGFNRTGDQYFVMTHEGQLYTFTTTGYLLKIEQVSPEEIEL